jgi:hypothetical protein
MIGGGRNDPAFAAAEIRRRSAMRKVFLSTLFAGAVGIGSAQAADIVVKGRPAARNGGTSGGAPVSGMSGLWDIKCWDGNYYV